MKAIFKLKKSIYYVAALAVAVSMASCDDDEKDKPLTLADISGTYDGKMYVKTPTDPATQTAAEEGSQTISGKLEETKAVFDKFPVNDFIIAIEGEEVGAEIIKDLEGDIKYELAYEAKLNEAATAINLTLKPGTLAFSYTVPDAEPAPEGRAEEGEGEGETGTKKEIVVTFKAVETADTYAKGAVKLNFISESIKVDDTALEGYKAQTIQIDLKKK